MNIERCFHLEGGSRHITVWLIGGWVGTLVWKRGQGQQSVMGRSASRNPDQRNSHGAFEDSGQMGESMSLSGPAPSALRPHGRPASQGWGRGVLGRPEIHAK